MSKNVVTVPAGADYFTIDRVLDAPRVLIWKCYTEPQHLARFWGPRDATTAATVDLRVGGVWRTSWTYQNGSEYGYSSVYLDLIEPERIHYRDAPTGLAGRPRRTAAGRADLDDRAQRDAMAARLSMSMCAAASVALRDETVARGFAGMVSVGNDRLDEYLRTLLAEGGK